MPSMSRTSSSTYGTETDALTQEYLGMETSHGQTFIIKVYPLRSQWRSFKTVRLRFENTYTSPFKGSRWQERMAPHRLSTSLRKSTGVRLITKRLLSFRLNMTFLRTKVGTS